MKRLLVVLVLLVLSSAPAWAQCTYTIGDGVNLSASEMVNIIDFFGLDVGLGPDWTLCIAPGVYELDPADGWPVVLPAHAPEIVGADGAEATVLVGDGSMGAFLLADGAQGRFNGLTFRTFGEAIALADLLAETTLEFTDNVMEYCASGLHVLQHDAIVSRNVFRYNVGRAIDVSGINGTVDQNEICYNGHGASFIYGRAFRGNHVHHNDGFGVWMSLGGNGIITYNLIEENGGEGVVTSTFGAETIEHNVIRGNLIGVRYYPLSATRAFSFHYNDLYDNTLFDVQCDASGGRFDLDATDNWWGTTDPLEISEHIFDCNDDPAVTRCVLFDPWCYAPGCEGATPVEAHSWGSIKALYR